MDRLLPLVTLDRRAFLLGAFAPDAIMFRLGCDKQDKCRSHFTPPGCAWAQVDDNEAWRGCLRDGLEPFAAHEHPYFLMGYRVHVLTDIAHSVLLPAHTPGQHGGGTRHIARDSGEIDTLLLASFGGEAALWPQLAPPPADTLGNLATTEDMTLIQTGMYHSRLPDPAYRFTMLTPAGMADFIESTAVHIAEMLSTQGGNA